VNIDSLKEVEKIAGFEQMQLLIELSFLNGYLRPTLKELKTTGLYTKRLIKEFSKRAAVSHFHAKKLLDLNIAIDNYECMVSLNGLGGSKIPSLTGIIYDYMNALRRGF
jgi:hypothetical protein